MIKTTDKFRNSFNFNWDTEDDTSKDHNPLYKYKMRENLLFGRGTRAGFDLTEQKNKLIDYSKLIDKSQKQRQPSPSMDEDDEGNTQRIFNVKSEPVKKFEALELGAEKNYKNKTFEDLS